VGSAASEALRSAKAGLPTEAFRFAEAGPPTVAFRFAKVGSSGSRGPTKNLDRLVLNFSLSLHFIAVRNPVK